MRCRSLSDSAEMGEAGEAFWAKAVAAWDAKKAEKIRRKTYRFVNIRMVFLIAFVPAERRLLFLIPAGLAFLFRETAFLDFPAVRRLNGASIIGIQSRKRCNLRRRKLPG